MSVFQLFNWLTDGLTVGNLRCTHVSFDLKLTLHAVHQDVEVQLTHTADDGLAGLFVQLHGEGRVLFSELLNSGTQLLLVGLGLRLNGHLNHRIREVHGLQDDLVIEITQGVASGGIFQADERVDVTCTCLINRVLLVGVHLEELANALALALGGVSHLGTRLNDAGVHAHEGQLAKERVHSNLESES